MLTLRKTINNDEWRRINFRNVDHLLAVEFLHNLYNRHQPRINSIRFRNTKTVWRNKQVNSYAPQDEWERMVKWLGEKYYSVDPILIREIQHLLVPDRSFIEELKKKINKTNIKTTSLKQLGLFLIDVQDVVLGEIYRVNIVQLEYSLNHILSKLLAEHEPNNAKRSELLSQIIIPDVPTESQLEELAFSKIVTLGKKRHIKNPKKDKKVMDLIQQHYVKYAYMHCGYGELPPVISVYIEKYVHLYHSESDMTKEEILDNISKSHAKAKKILKSLKDPKLNVLVPLMSKIGVFRDLNKAYMGQTVRYRLLLLDEIARRKLDTRDNLNYYLLSELLDLLDQNIILDQEIILAREQKGITLSREEYLENKFLKIRNTSDDTKKVSMLSGVCASPGNITGICKIIYSTKDIVKINKGDIMVAIGTDFDVLEAMHLSAGIITEEGGLLSHASVVSREINKPCCIGVANATQILKDNMQVNLDSANGVITIL